MASDPISDELNDTTTLEKVLISKINLMQYQNAWKKNSNNAWKSWVF